MVLCKKATIGFLSKILIKDMLLLLPIEILLLLKLCQVWCPCLMMRQLTNQDDLLELLWCNLCIQTSWDLKRVFVKITKLQQKMYMKL